MKYIGLPHLMWIIYKKSFKKNLIITLSFSKVEASEITKLSKIKYKEIIKKLPTFDKKDSFITNSVNCALYSSFLLSMKRKITLEEATIYYQKSMMTRLVKLAFKVSGKSK